MVGRATDKSVFQIRLNELFARSGRRLTNAAVTKSLLAQGCHISAPYLSQLRNGVRGNPSDEVVEALARYFGVAPGYFFTIPWSGDRNHAQLDDASIIAQLHDPSMKYLLELANGLTAQSLDLLADTAERFRVSDRRVIIPADSPSYVRLVEASFRGASTGPTLEAKVHTFDRGVPKSVVRPPVELRSLHGLNSEDR